MSQFEFIMVMVSLILALAMAQALRGLSEIATSPTRYLPHTLWLVVYVFLITQNWWAYWDFIAVDEWRFTTYLMTLTLPAISFANIYLLVPATRTTDVEWREQYIRVKRWFFGLGVAYVLLAIFIGAEFFGTPLSHPYRLFQGFFATIHLVAMFSSNEKVQRILPILALGLLAMGQFLIRIDIGALIGE